jgi:hypothetical protein
MDDRLLLPCEEKGLIDNLKDIDLQDDVCEDLEK